MRYEDTSFSFIKNISEEINKVAQALGLNPQLIAGAIAEEDTSQKRQNPIKKGINGWLDKGVATASEEALRADYQEVIDKGIIDDKGPLVTLRNYGMRDIGPGNIRFAVAVKEVQDALQTPLGKLLGLEKYANDFSTLAKDLYDPLGSDQSIGDHQDRDSMAIAAIAGLHLKRDKDWLLSKVDKQYWEKLPPEVQDAVLVTLYNNGLARGEDSYEKQIYYYGSYQPLPGGSESGGIAHEINAKELTVNLNLQDSTYGNFRSKSIYDFSHAERVELANKDDILGAVMRHAILNNIRVIFFKDDVATDIFGTEAIYSPDNANGMTSVYIEHKSQLMMWNKLNNHRLKTVGLTNGLKVRIRVATNDASLMLNPISEIRYPNSAQSDAPNTL